MKTPWSLENAILSKASLLFRPEQLLIWWIATLLGLKYRRVAGDWQLEIPPSTAIKTCWIASCFTSSATLWYCQRCDSRQHNQFNFKLTHNTVTLENIMSGNHASVFFFLLFSSSLEGQEVALLKNSASEAYTLKCLLKCKVAHKEWIKWEKTQGLKSLKGKFWVEVDAQNGI